jgi:hypothetical protein
MDKKVPLFKYETFAVRRAKCIEANDLPRKQER